MRTKEEIKQEIQELNDCIQSILALDTMDKAKISVTQKLQAKVNALEWVLNQQ
jgi:hypothetical protein